MVGLSALWVLNVPTAGKIFIKDECDGTDMAGETAIFVWIGHHILVIGIIVVLVNRMEIDTSGDEEYDVKTADQVIAGYLGLSGILGRGEK